MNKYRNPPRYLHEESLRTISRRDLAHDLDGYIGLRESNSETESDPTISAAISALDELLSPLRTDFASAIRGRKRKRDDTSVCTVNRDQATEIRLVSRKPTAVTTSGLVDGRLIISQPKTYPNEDTDEEAEERKRRAAQAAMDFELIRKQSTIPYPSFKAAASPGYKLKDMSTPKTIAVVECPKPRQSRPVHLRTAAGQLKTRDPKIKKSLVASAQSNFLPPNPQSESPQRTFYHSDKAVGGKSAGYAWGYRGSFPRSVGIAGYLRDSMKRGLDITVADREATMTQVMGVKTKPPISRRKRT
ncbi:unnamed protein product [Rhizoctonia solani]|uniref:Uncharacterized protein n=1 Tax=Rhizoctonia solani TaxID=456999 RepID=A0A8H2XAX8_9AGAM|nr:unnamed protein product [Rhizoctonia solani]